MVSFTNFFLIAFSILNYFYDNTDDFYFIGSLFFPTLKYIPFISYYPLNLGCHIPMPYLWIQNFSNFCMYFFLCIINFGNTYDCVLGFIFQMFALVIPAFYTPYLIFNGNFSYHMGIWRKELLPQNHIF